MGGFDIKIILELACLSSWKRTGSSIMWVMKMKFATNQVDDYQVETNIYSGPLDLLLELIENAELDITALSLAKVTDQYLEHIRKLQNMRPDEVSAFMVIAAKLLQIKSEALLPRPPIRKEDEESPGDELARQLLAYKRYKEIAEILADRKQEGLHTYLRLSPPLEVNDQVDFGDFGVVDLWKTAKEALNRSNNQKSINTVVQRPKFTIQDKIKDISTHLLQHKRAGFYQLLGSNYTKLEVVISFLAILELIRGKYIQCRQSAMFDEIKLVVVNEGKLKSIDVENEVLDIM